MRYILTGNDTASLLHRAALAPLVLLCVTPSTAACIRSLRYDGANAAWLLASLHAGECATKLSGAETALPVDLHDTRRLVERLGCDARITTPTYAELASEGTPSLVLLRPGSSIQGQFAVVLSASPSETTFVYGGPLTVQVVSADAFRRMWTGHAITPAPTSVSPARAVLMLIAFSLPMIVAIAARPHWR